MFGEAVAGDIVDLAAFAAYVVDDADAVAAQLGPVAAVAVDEADAGAAAVQVDFEIGFVAGEQFVEQQCLEPGPAAKTELQRPVVVGKIRSDLAREVVDFEAAQADFPWPKRHQEHQNFLQGCRDPQNQIVPSRVHQRYLEKNGAGHGGQTVGGAHLKACLVVESLLVKN